MPKTFAVIGLGLFGQKVCEILAEKGGEVIAIDNSPSQVNKVKDYVSQAILLDSTDEESLADAPLDQVDAAVVAIGDNIEASILTTALMKQIGVPLIIARAVNKNHSRVLKKVGADEVINIEERQGRRVALNLISPSVMERVVLSGNLILSEANLPEPYIKYKAQALNLENRFGIRLSAIRRVETALDGDGNTLRNEKVIFPGPDDILKEGDTLILIGEEEKIEEFLVSTGAGS
jgi:trk system potassium uptake protein TrkA